MPGLPHSRNEKEAPTGYNYDADPAWRKKPLTPAQLLVHDVRIEKWMPNRGPRLEIMERTAASIVPETAARTSSASCVRATEASNNPIEKQNFTNLEEDYGWMRYLRLQKYQRHAYDDEDSAKCRWIHCSSKFSEYLSGFLWALSDDMTIVADSLRLLDHAIQRQTRFSKHGKYFMPFWQTLQPSNGSDEPDALYPMLISVPFLDWTVLGSTPPLRFQVDRREGYQSARTSAHLLRSILQHFYRLEDTRDRESSQVFSRHQPWRTNRELDLKVRQWYGHYPSGLNVDELWILAIDAEHIVTLSSNQTWKSRWPPLQLTSRISDISFRSIRNSFYTSEEEPEYTAWTHTIASLGGAVGMLHRSFWPDIVLCLTDRYAGYLGHLQYRLHRNPSSKLVMELIACQEELNIVIQITQQQIDMITGLQSKITPLDPASDAVQLEKSSGASRRPASAGYDEFGEFDVPTVSRRSTHREISSSTLNTPIGQLLDNLQREIVDLQDLRDNTDRLVTRTIQLVNIRLEDHGKAILVFTVVTIVFLPLNFVCSFFGMNVYDIRNMVQTQWVFWAVACSITTAVVASSIFLAFSGGDIMEKVMLWRDARKERRANEHPLAVSNTKRAEHTFKVYGTGRSED